MIAVVYDKEILKMLLPLAFLQNMGAFEWLIILVICLLLFGHKLPSVARSLGSSVNEFKKGAREGEEEALKAQTPTANATGTATAAPATAVSQLKCSNCGALYVPGGPGAPCPNCQTVPPVASAK